MIVYVEMHWILSWVLAQDPQNAGRLLGPFFFLEPPKITLPSFCLAEAISRFRTIENDIHQLREKLDKQKRESLRVDVEEANKFAIALERAIRRGDQFLTRLRARFDAFLMEMLKEVDLVETEVSAMELAISFMDDLRMTRGDAIILATVLRHASRSPSEEKRSSAATPRILGGEHRHTINCRKPGSNTSLELKTSLVGLLPNHKRQRRIKYDSY
ncbi:MAG: hypothetical protein HY314_08835 [Acidobacteria bacterium]|nr:hypothetical protein [Acidobacteriota bacterium]